MFQLKEPTNVTLLHINVRVEKHGKEEVDAYDFDFSLTGQNADVLQRLHPGLCEFLYFDEDGDDGQETAPGIPKVLPNLRFPKLANFPWPLEGAGYDLGIIYGLGDERSNIAFEGGKAVCKRVENEEGGTSTIFFRYSTSGMQDGVLDKLRTKQRQQLTITLVQPEKLRNDAVIDGTVGHPGAAATEGQGSLLDEEARADAATAAFLGQHGDDASTGEGSGGEGDDADAGTGEGDDPDLASASAFEAGVKRELEARGVQAKRGSRAKAAA